MPAPRQLVWYLLRAEADLTAEETTALARIRQHPDVDTAYRLTRQFQQMIRLKADLPLSNWLRTCLDSSIPDLQTFATSLQREEPSIRLAIASSFSNGPIEGHDNRLKFIKRSMYGRSNFDLLRIRVLALSG